MTREEIERMEAGREMDSLIAEKVMGWRWSGENKKWLIPPDDDPRIAWAALWDKKGRPDWLPDYSTDIADAWQVVEKLHDLGYRVEINSTCDKGLYDVEVSKSYSNGTVCECVVFQPISLAICRAALLSVMEAQP